MHTHKVARPTRNDRMHMTLMRPGYDLYAFCHAAYSGCTRQCFEYIISRDNGMRIARMPYAMNDQLKSINSYLFSLSLGKLVRVRVCTPIN